MKFFSVSVSKFEAELLAATKRKELRTQGKDNAPTASEPESCKYQYNHLKGT